jgi:hypothetical protein
VPAPTPAIPSFTDGTLVRQGDLNALASNLTNLYSYNHGGFRTQRDCVIVTANSASIAATTDTLISFASASVNTNGMWVAGSPTQITIQTAGVYWVFSQTRWPTVNAPTNSNVVASNLLANGTAVSNTVASNLVPMIATGGGAGPSNQCSTLINLAAGATLYLDVWQNASTAISTGTDYGGTFLGAIYQTPGS